MIVKTSIEKLLHMQEPGLALNLLLLPLTLCSWLYRLVVTVRAGLYARGLIASRRLPCRVVTVGNLTVGGTGKTPTVEALARICAEAGLHTAVLSRGYGGSERGPLIVSDGSRTLATARQCGDEPFMLAQSLRGVPVLTARDRYQGGMLACEHFNPHVLVLDDGFQHLRLKRDLDIVLVNARNPFGCGALLPRGILREPPAALRRARIIILTKADSIVQCGDLEYRISAINPAASVHRARLKPVALIRPVDGCALELETVRGRTTAALCSIGDPGHFCTMLAGLGAIYSRPLIFPDHHRYSTHDAALIAQRAAAVEFLITTEKDIVKMSSDMLQIPNLLVLQVRQLIEDHDRFVQQVFDCIGMPSSRPGRDS